MLRFFKARWGHLCCAGLGLTGCLAEPSGSLGQSGDARLQQPGLQLIGTWQNKDTLNVYFGGTPQDLSGGQVVNDRYDLFDPGQAEKVVAEIESSLGVKAESWAVQRSFKIFSAGEYQLKAMCRDHLGDLANVDATVTITDLQEDGGMGRFNVVTLEDQVKEISMKGGELCQAAIGGKSSYTDTPHRSYRITGSTSGNPQILRMTIDGVVVESKRSSGE